MKFRVVPFALLAAGLAGPASATLFSFPSDADHTSWTFSGLGASVRDAADPADPQLLVIDDDNGITFPTLLQTEFNADFSLQYLGSTPFVGGKFTHQYAMSGTFTFLDLASNLPIMMCTVTDALFTAVGNGGTKPATWDSTATIQASDDYGTVTYTWFGPADPLLGVYPGNSVGLDTAAFTLTVLNVDGQAGVGLDGATHLPVSTWYSEGSYSGSAHFVPAPGALAVVGAAGLAAARRKRR